MLLTNFGFILTSLLALLSASETADKHCKPCHHSSSSSSSSSSHHCRGCPDEAARKKVKALQAEAEYFLQTHNQARFQAISSYDQTFSIYELGCGACCVQTGTDFFARYALGDKLAFFAPNEQYIKRFENGTVVVSKLVTVVPVADPFVVAAYTLNFNWNPEPYGKCNFKLSYIDGNVINCPNYVYEAPACDNCPP